MRPDGSPALAGPRPRREAEAEAIFRHNGPPAPTGGPEGGPQSNQLELRRSHETSLEAFHNIPVRCLNSILYEQLIICASLFSSLLAWRHRTNNKERKKTKRGNPQVKGVSILTSLHPGPGVRGFSTHGLGCGWKTSRLTSHCALNALGGGKNNNHANG